jgi:hypothetical protein
MLISSIKGWFLVSAGTLLLLTGCGKDTKTEYVQVSAPDSTYLVEYVPGTMQNGMMMSAAMGKTKFQIKVRKRSDGSAATGLSSSMTVYPLMHMNDGRNHASPADPVIESGTPGTYDCTVYYLMADKMGSTVTGFWELTVAIGTESAIFNPSVGMSMGDTSLFKLYGNNDLIKSTTTSTMPEKRVYLLFHDGLVGGATYSTLNLFIATKETMLHFPAVSIGTVLSNTTGTWAVNGPTTSLYASLDSTFSAGTVTGVDNGGGHWSLPEVTGLSSGATTTVYVKFTVNSELKTAGTTTAAAGYASFSVTP